MFFRMMIIFLLYYIFYLYFIDEQKTDYLD